MIRVENLMKSYGPTVAVKDVSFEVKKGEILGFLGPNGAGKTTTMRILAGFFPPSFGRAYVAGYDVFKQPLEAKRAVGYMPESPPLYTEMTVDSYLRFVARIKAVNSGEIKSRIAYVKDRCGLHGEGDRLIKHLSKGYRQRVGLAQALIHNPQVLILDEPTVGLDPKQIIEVRDLIKSLGGDHTVILSTHILPEVSMTCERVIIINNGRIEAADTPENLMNQLGGGTRIEFEVEGPAHVIPDLVQSIPGVKSVRLESSVDNRNRFVVEAEGQQEVRPLIARKLLKSGFELYQLKSQGMTLEQIFLKLTTEEESA